MSLTGLTLTVLAFCGTAAVSAATVWGWSRSRSLRFVLRPLGVLLTEALLLLSIGLVVNRQEDFYPSWAALLEPGKPAVPAYRTVAGGLDATITAQAAGKGALPQLITWQPAEWAEWRLTAAPTVVVPAGYSQHPQWRYSVVLVIAQSGQGWPTTWQRPAGLNVAGGATHDVVVFATATSKTAVPALTSQLPDDLRHDLRVTDHRWAVVTAPANAGLTQRAVLSTPGQYPAIATLLTNPPPHAKKPPPKASSRKPATSRPSTANGSSATALAALRRSAGGHASTGLPAGITSATIRAAPTTAGILTGLAAAVHWAAGQTPPPLAASSPPVKSLPVHKHPRSSTAPKLPGSSASANLKRNLYDAGQPGH